MGNNEYRIRNWEFRSEAKIPPSHGDVAGRNAEFRREAKILLVQDDAVGRNWKRGTKEIKR